jgi:hypothetical protein
VGFERRGEAKRSSTVDTMAMDEICLLLQQRVTNH